MKRYLVPPKVEVKPIVYRRVGYTFVHRGEEYTIYANNEDTARRVWDELIKSGDVNYLIPNR